MSDSAMLDIIELAALQLRDCYWWRRLVDPNNPWDDATAAAHIHFDELPPPANNEPVHSLAELESLRPYAIVFADIDEGFRWRTSTSDFCCSMVSGAIVMRIELAVPSELASTPKDLAIYLHRTFGRIMRTADDTKPGLLDLAKVPGYLPINDATITGYLRSSQQHSVSYGDAVEAAIHLKWGVTG